MIENEWKIAKPAGACCLCAQQFAPGSAYYSALLQSAESLQRLDYCEACFQSRRPEQVYYFWKRSCPDPESEAVQRRPLVDIEYVLEFFRRLEGDASSQKQAFRYILALMLTRKKVLIAEGRVVPASVPAGRNGDAGGPARSIQVFRERRAGQAHEVVEPELSEAEMESVSAELGVLLGLSSPAAKTGTAQPVAAAAAETMGAQPGGSE